MYTRLKILMRKWAQKELKERRKTHWLWCLRLAKRKNKSRVEEKDGEACFILYIPSQDPKMHQTFSFQPTSTPLLWNTYCTAQLPPGNAFGTQHLDLSPDIQWQWQDSVKHTTQREVRKGSLLKSKKLMFYLSLSLGLKGPATFKYVHPAW